MYKLRSRLPPVYVLRICGIVCFLFHSVEAPPIRTTVAGSVVAVHSRTTGQDIFPDNSILDKIVKQNQDEDKILFEGDIVLPQESRRVKRNAQRSRANLWQTKIVPYELSNNLIGSHYATNIAKAIEDFSEYTCITWKPRTNETNWIRFVDNKGCWSAVGKEYWKAGAQELSLGVGCSEKGVILHEMMHAVGFWHEQSRTDRNQYVEVMWENIVQGKEHNFERYSHGKLDMMGLNYDYNSLMHYGNKAFSLNDKPTLLAVGDPWRELGSSVGFSQGDILEINALYDCEGTAGGWSSWTPFSSCDRACKKHRQRFCTADKRETACLEANEYGIQQEERECSQQECNVLVDGHWGRWSSWSNCSAACDFGIHTRTRQCNDPAPVHGGLDCVGDSKANHTCIVRSCGVGLDDCQFDDDQFCHWTDDVTGTSRLPWKHSFGGTPTSSTGPSADHSGSGGFIFAEASSPVQTGQTTRIISKDFPPIVAACMSFYYHMYGTGIGALHIYIKTASKIDRVWSMDGNQGNQWEHSHVTITSTVHYNIVFEAVRGSDYRGDIALDDVTFADVACAHPSTTHNPTTLVMTTAIPTLPPDVCDFGRTSGTYCTWYNDPTNSRTANYVYRFNWWLHYGRSPSYSTGPDSDHTGNGYYIYLEVSSPYQEGMKGRIVSKQYPASPAMCLSFWYNMYGASVGMLSVFIRNSAGHINLWERTGDQGPQWIKATVPLSTDSYFKVVIEGTRGPGYLGDIALDDVTIKHGACV